VASVHDGHVADVVLGHEPPSGRPWSCPHRRPDLPRHEVRNLRLEGVAALSGQCAHHVSSAQYPHQPVSTAGSPRAPSPNTGQRPSTRADRGTSVTLAFLEDRDDACHWKTSYVRRASARPSGSVSTLPRIEILSKKTRVVNIRSSGLHFSPRSRDRELLQLVVTVKGLDGAHRARA